MSSPGETDRVTECSSVTGPSVLIVETEEPRNLTNKSVSEIRRWIFRRHKKEMSREGYTEFGGLNESSNGRTLSTFSGVFSPVALSMFSALLFLRVGFVVGNSGLLETFLEFFIAYCIIFFTVSSVCAVATNGEVEGGGAYFMISRTLGPEFGGSIGTLFFFANIVSSALYTVGFSEGLISNFGRTESSEGLPVGNWWPFLYASSLNFFNLVICLLGAELFAKTTVFVFITVAVCLASSFLSFLFQPEMAVELPDSVHINVTNATYTALNWSTLQANLFSDYGTDYTSNGLPLSFSIVFGVLFSGVTGIMAGANMSGELKNPARSIPRGTISAVCFTMIVYVLISIFTAASCTRILLQNNYLYLKSINFWPPFVTIGILTATFSASLSNLIGSSRVLEALARDNIYGRYLNIITQGTWRSNPIIAVLIAWFLVQLMLLIGSLNMIAQINSILFLLAYLALNLACLGLELASAPNFRPTFKYFSWYTAALGLLGSVVMMFVIDPFYASSSIGLCLLIILLLHLFSPARSDEWGSISQALIFHQVRKYLLLLDSRKDHVKFWRPQMLLMVSNPRATCPLIDFVNDLKKSGLYVLGHVNVNPNFLTMQHDPVADEYNDWLSVVDVLKVKAFVEITVANSVREGLQHLARIAGMGAMKPNTIIFGFYDNVPQQSFLSSSIFSNGLSDEEKFPLRKPNNGNRVSVEDYVNMIRDVLVLRKNVCVARNFHNFDKNSDASLKWRYVDVWAMNFFNPNIEDAFDTTSLFMLQLACILTMVQCWKRKHLQVRVFVCERGGSKNIEENVNLHVGKFKMLLESLRIKATVITVKNWPENVPLTFDFSANPLPENIKTYFKNINDIILEKSFQTAFLLSYLPLPFQSNSAGNYSAENYLKCLTEITNYLPATMMVHGISPVTSTTL